MLRICQTVKDIFDMNTEHRYIFEKGSKKHYCPDCNKKRFVRYIDTETGEYLAEQYGKCDRIMKCSYYLDPYKDGFAKAIRDQEQGNKMEPVKVDFEQIYSFHNLHGFDQVPQREYICSKSTFTGCVSF